MSNGGANVIVKAYLEEHKLKLESGAVRKAAREREEELTLEAVRLESADGSDSDEESGGQGGRGGDPSGGRRRGAAVAVAAGAGSRGASRGGRRAGLSVGPAGKILKLRRAITKRLK